MSSPDSDSARRPIEQHILYELVPFDGEPGLWKVDDLAQQLEECDIGDRVEELISVGLVSQTPDERIFASPAAVYLIELIGHVA